METIINLIKALKAWLDEFLAVVNNFAAGWNEKDGTYGFEA